MAAAAGVGGQRRGVAQLAGQASGFVALDLGDVLAGSVLDGLRPRLLGELAGLLLLLGLLGAVLLLPGEPFVIGLLLFLLRRGEVRRS